MKILNTVFQFFLLKTFTPLYTTVHKTAALLKGNLSFRKNNYFHEFYIVKMSIQKVNEPKKGMERDG